MAENAPSPLPIGTSDFEALRDAGQIYVDKTALVYQLASLRQKFFLTRPRRFGKSVLVTTFASLFKKGLTYFSGLAIEKLWKDTTYNVVEIDFSEIKNIEDLQDFYTQLDGRLIDAFEPAGFHYDESAHPSVIRQLSRWMKRLPTNSLVLLIDEYDSPLTACLRNPKLFKSVCTRLSSFYATVKANDACLRFVFMTGIVKFNQTGIFSELNNFTDISLDPMFSTLLGYTDEDITRYFSGYLTKAAETLKLPPNEVLARLRENYDGFCFDDEVTEHLYAPWSVLNFFSRPSRGFINYWMRSGGTPNLLQEYLHSHALKTPSEYGADQLVKYADLDCSADLDHINDVSLLTQAGYLTIKKRNFNSFWVGYPNKEVAVSLAQLYSEKLLRDQDLTAVKAETIIPALNNGDISELFESANRAFAALNYVRFPITEEKFCQAYLQVFIAGAGFTVKSETEGSLGRSDLEVDTEKLHWVIELKFQRKKQNAEAMLTQALQQIRDRNYGAASPKKLIRVAAVFSEEKRAFVCWKATDDE